MTTKVDSERFIRAITDNLPAMVAYWDSDLRCQFANAPYGEWFGRDSDQMIGITMPELMGADLFARNEPFIRAAMRGESQAFERTLVKPSGEVGHTWAQYIPDVDDAGRVKGMYVLVTDVTALQQAQEDLKSANNLLREARDKADAANRAKSDFLAMMSHEIRTPMHGIMGMNSLLQASGLNERQTGYARAIETSAESLMSIINDLLDVSKLEAGRLELESVAFDLPGLVEAVVDLFRPLASRKGLTLAAEIAAPALGAFVGDPSRLRQVLMNLVSNAVKFTETGSVEVKVDARPGKANNVDLRIEVADTGIGLSDAALARLFQPFAQADNSITRRYGGTGLGLNICRRLVELMGGEISADNRPGGGSLFSLQLHLTAAAALEPSEPTTEPSVALGTKTKVLLAEDHEVNRALAMVFLADAGFDVDVAENGIDAVQAAQTTRYDAILMDVRMPKLDGLDATRQIRAAEFGSRRTPIIAMTADASADDRQRCLEAGMDDFISKPFNPEQIVAAVSRWAA
jgi:PAS domain S-box-containing protein